MARCARKACGRWRPGLFVRVGGVGLRLNDAWYCSVQCLELAVRDRLARIASIVPPALPAIGRPRLGGVLATQKRLPRDVVEHAASEQARTGLRIGTQLVELGVVSKFDVLRALASQCGVGFLTTVDAARVMAAPGNLSPHVVRALGLVPFESDHTHDVLKVACTAPVPRAAVAALRELTGLIIEPYLVADEQWPTLARAYGASSRVDGPVYSALPDVAAAAARVADLARQAREVRMTEARCDEHLWVRLDVGTRIEEFWLTVGAAAASATALPEMSILEETARDAQPSEPARSSLPVRARAKRPRAVRAASSPPRPRRRREEAKPLVPADLQTFDAARSVEATNETSGQAAPMPLRKTPPSHRADRHHGLGPVVSGGLGFAASGALRAVNGLTESRQPIGVRGPQQGR